MLTNDTGSFPFVSRNGAKSTSTGFIADGSKLSRPCQPIRSSTFWITTCTVWMCVPGLAVSLARQPSIVPTVIVLLAAS